MNSGHLPAGYFVVVILVCLVVNVPIGEAPRGACSLYYETLSLATTGMNHRNYLSRIDHVQRLAKYENKEISWAARWLYEAEQVGTGPNSNTAGYGLLDACNREYRDRHGRGDSSAQTAGHGIRLA